jgi:hypothetical protein
MKARVKATGHIVDVELSHYIGDVEWYITKCHASYSENELEFIDAPEDYWTRLEHQYAGMAMQSYVSNNVYLKEIREMCKEPQEMRNLIADLSILLATTIVQKLKEKEEKK